MLHKRRLFQSCGRMKRSAGARSGSVKTVDAMRVGYHRTAAIVAGSSNAAASGSTSIAQVKHVYLSRPVTRIGTYKRDAS